MREHAPRHDRPIPELHLHEIIAKIAVNHMTGIDEPEATVTAPQPVIVPVLPVIKIPRKERN